MLHLELPTDPRWADIAHADVAEILTDHAYCEQKAASSCISLIVQYPELEELVAVLTPVVAEEWSHFERVIEMLKKRGYKFGRQRKDEYVNALQKFVRKGNQAHQLIDKLLVCALIEARSCERFKVLWKHFEGKDQELSSFYYELMVSEAGHYTNFIELARNYGSRADADARWQAFLAYETEILAEIGYREGRIH